ncbi:hypothetical protein B0O80DRAFT_443567 [Mortierella sp. GBAus27b]|nr:hypothetical protein BGX31_000057 [Mortierella sp. GBA43]KAI8357959.1 hypothetical protein B0O80DRAFT_443567 [Mortierella sp. GBAus27b]
MSADDGTPNYYEVLCLNPGATKDDVKKAYRKQALLFHPDKMKPHMKDEASAHFQLISEAYEVLSNDAKRALYDRYGPEGVKAGGDPNPQPDPGFHSHHMQGFQDPFFSSFGVPAHHQAFPDMFARHHEHVRLAQQMFGGFSQGPSMFQDHFHNFFNNGHSPFDRPPFANSEWSGMGTSNNPFVDIGGGGGGGGNSGSGRNFSSSSFSSSSSGGGGRSGAARTFTKTSTTIVNGRQTTVTEVTDAQGVTTKTVEKSDGTREVFVNGVPTTIEGSSSSQPPPVENSRQQPITILDDDDDEDNYGRDNARRWNSQPGRSPAPTEPIVLDADEDDVMYEDLSRSRHRARTHLNPQRTSGRQGSVPPPTQGPPPPPPGPGPNQSQGNWDNPNLHHPQMGRGQTLRGSMSRHNNDN